ncbi:hypothetical protein HQ545_04255 [Candidatus Woesearchaeota archaeon]|nr:hypothetical protein [Candidatus Woesearchaeota archaeon]
MISAKLIKDLEKHGFELEFPTYGTNEDMILEIINEENERLYPAIPLLLLDHFNYDLIKHRLKPIQRKKFDFIILIADSIFKKEKLDNKNTKQIITDNKIKQRIPKESFEYYHAAFKDSMKRKEEQKEEQREEQLDIRNTLNINKSLSTIYAPGKLRIMNKIYNHEHLTNTELKYYYRSIRPFILSILNENLRKYIMIIESSKKYTQ